LGIVTTLLAIAPFASYEDVPWHMKTSPVPVHAVKVLDNRVCTREFAPAVGTVILKRFPDRLFVSLTVHFQRPFARKPPAQLVEEHTHELVCNVGLRPPGRGSELC